MDKELKRFIYAAVLIIGTVLISLAFSDTNNYSNSSSTYYDSSKSSSEYTITSLLEDKPLEQNVEVIGNVSDILADYTSKKGYIYQQIMFSDGSSELLIFCSTYKGRKDLNIGDTIKVEGKFQKYNEKYEIYTYCSQIQKL